MVSAWYALCLRGNLRYIYASVLMGVCVMCVTAVCVWQFMRVCVMCAMCVCCVFVCLCGCVFVCLCDLRCKCECVLCVSGFALYTSMCIGIYACGVLALKSSAADSSSVD